MSKKQNVQNPGSAEKQSRELPTFQDILNDFQDGLTTEQIAEKRNLKLDTVKAKIPRLQLEAKRAEDRAIAKLEREGKLLLTKPGNDGTQNIQSTGNTPNPGIQNPSFPAITPQNPPGTGMVPAVPPNVTLPPVQPTLSTSSPTVPVLQPTPQTSPVVMGGDGKRRPEAPTFLRRVDDGGEAVQPVEFMLRGVSSKENLSPITVVLLSYFRYLGGDDMAGMSMGDCIDYVVRRFCREHGVDLQIGRKILGEDVQI
jgi:hypothetical protein